MVRGQVREDTGKSLRRTLDEGEGGGEGELKREENRGVSSMNSDFSSWCWQLMEVGTTYGCDVTRTSLSSLALQLHTRGFPSSINRPSPSALKEVTELIRFLDQVLMMKDMV